MTERVETTRVDVGPGAQVGGRGGASGGRGRLRLRALKGFVSLFSTPSYLLTRCGGFKRLPPLPPTSIKSVGCRLLDLVPIWVAVWRPLVTCVVTWDGPCKLAGAFGLDGLSQGAQMSYLAITCGREHRFEEICWILGPEPWQPVAGCCNRVDPLQKI